MICIMIINTTFVMIMIIIEIQIVIHTVAVITMISVMSND